MPQQPVVELVNLTPHSIRLDLDGVTVELPPTGTVARVELIAEAPATIRARGISDRDTVAIPIVSERPGAVHGLPRPRPGVRYVVSRAVLDAEPHRADLLCPTDLVRDDGGFVVACRRFAQRPQLEAGPSPPA